MPDFGPHWRTAPDKTIEYEGRRLQLAYTLTVVKGDRLHLFFERFISRPVQGLGLSLEGKSGNLEIAATRSRHFALWADTAPRHVECLVANAKAGAQLTLMNQWRDEKHGTTLYGLNAASMEVSNEADGSILLSCSDGWGVEPDFTDLVVRLIVERAG